MRVLGALAGRYAAEVLTLAWCTRIQRRDGVVVAFTEHDREIVIGGQAYHPGVAARVTALEERLGLGVDNAELTGVTDPDWFRPAELAAGAFVDARITHFQADWTDPSLGGVTHLSGWMGAARVTGREFAIEIRGLPQAFARIGGRVFTPDCPYRFGHGRCTVDLAPLTFSGSVTAPGTQSQFWSDAVAAHPDGFFDFGELRFTGGANLGVTARVRATYADGRVVLSAPLHGEIAVDDTFEITRGCAKTVAACRAWNNLPEYGGFPHLPGADGLLDHPR